MVISIVISYYNSEYRVNELLSRLSSVITQNLDYQFEIIVVDDGSDHFEINPFIEFPNKNFSIKIIQLDNNYGQIIAILTGLHYCSGDSAIIMSSDLQDPPELINKILDLKNKTQCEVVACVREQRKDSFIRKLGASIWYKFVVKNINENYPKGGGDYALINRRVINLLLMNSSTVRFIQNEIIVNSKSTNYIKYKREASKARKSEWKLSKIFLLILDIVFTHINVKKWMINLNILLLSLLTLIIAIQRSDFSFPIISVIIFITVVINIFYFLQLSRVRKKRKQTFNPTKISTIIFED